MPKSFDVTMPQSSDETMPQSSDETMPQSSDVTMPQSSDVTMPKSSDVTIPKSFDVTMPQSSDVTMPKSSDETVLQSSDETVLQSSDEIMRDFELDYPFNIYTNTNTYVFWDVEDYPIPNGLDPASIYQNIKEAIKKQGCLEEVSIQAYVDKNTLSDELQRNYADAGIKITFFPQGHKYERAYLMLFDIMLWAYENPSPSNLIVLSKNIIGLDMVSCFQGLYQSQFSVLLSQTQRSALFLTSLFDGAKPSGSSQRLDNKKRKIADILPDSDD